MRSVNQFIKAVEDLKPGESIEVDTRICRMAITNRLRKYVEDGTLAPSEEELKKHDERIRDYYRTGWWLADKMIYIKKGE